MMRTLKTALQIVIALVVGFLVAGAIPPFMIWSDLQPVGTPQDRMQKLLTLAALAFIGTSAFVLWVFHKVDTRTRTRVTRSTAE